MKVPKSTDAGMRHYFLKLDLTAIHKRLDELKGSVDRFKKTHDDYGEILSQIREIIVEAIGKVEDVEAELDVLGNKLSGSVEKARLNE